MGLDCFRQESTKDDLKKSFVRSCLSNPLVNNAKKFIQSSEKPVKVYNRECKERIREAGKLSPPHIARFLDDS